MKFNEDTRVKIPSILHLTRLGYEYISLKNSKWDENTNIFKDIFLESVKNINKEKKLNNDEILRVYDDISLLLENDDLGKAFYDRLTEKSGIKLIDFEDFNNNNFNVVTELTYKKDEDEFRPDIILLINGMPLVFIEVKKPNNSDGVRAERKRIETRFQNKAFKKFVNLTQLMIFSNNMEYDNESSEPIQGAFYATSSYHKPIFNYFREEENLDLESLLNPLDENVENFVLKDTNYQTMKSSPEFLTNKNPNTPTNRLSTSILSKERLAFILKYAIAYVHETKGIEKHIMRYPQIFATKAIKAKLDDGVKKGIIWHTQGSGKTALTYYNVKHLTDYFQAKNIIPKFYFIVDRIDLLQQAHKEFSSRGLTVHTISTRNEFIKDIKKTTAIHNNSGKAEITVVNIHKFDDDPNKIVTQDYNFEIQRVYFLDEVHRSYNPKGSFLANLNESDPNAIKIGLTGTPLIGDIKSKDLFGGYIHKYYYNSSIADGYTLRLIREEIETNYKMQLEKILKDIEILKGEADKKYIYSHKSFVEPMLDYIITDFENSRVRFNDNSIGGMVICDSSEQAKEMFEIFNKKYASRIDSNEKIVKTSALILHDIGTKQERKDWVEEFKDGKIDFLFVYDMLLTGFDAKRLKKLYLGRLIRKHKLLQALTRVNRTYKDFRYGFVVDFADISKEFDATNKAYFDELQSELGDEMEHYSNLFKSKEEIEEEINEIKEILFKFDTTNAEIFSSQINQIEDIKQMQGIVKVLDNAKSLYNLIRLTGNYELLDKIDFAKLTLLYREAQNHLNLLNLKSKVEDGTDTTGLLNAALEDIVFMFRKIGEEELVLADKLKDTLRKTREALAGNFDKKDPEFISLKEELERLFKKKKLSEVSQEEMNANIGALNKIHEKIKELNRQNNLLSSKYNNDPKYARIHKRLVERGDISKRESQIFEALAGVKIDADEKVLSNTDMLNNESYFERMMISNVIARFKNEQKIELNTDATKYINKLVVNEYINEFNGVNA
ncbi:type I restriction endonuclease subunit R [Aliarcobacter butzleri]|uniref:type I site-specific deoxyribonuclease n=1 Tax=Aliarcobacter butzleri TaxID=28197 RepID=A0AAW7Q1F4_9BACT|nr:type I restriction endonuclease [Aliarcobacter butzleri]MDN5113049.1 DEAD/DEAH box helicase family protein [Aliarcobacter butzleri]RZV14782.1 type I restriction endonuclease subunit R [Aliarcobacter butzleri]